MSDLFHSSDSKSPSWDEAVPDAELSEALAYLREALDAPFAGVVALPSGKTLAQSGPGAPSPSLWNSFCAQAVRQEGIFAFEDSASDAAFRFGVGLTIQAEDLETFAVGVFDVQPPELTPFQRKTLRFVAHGLENHLRLRRQESSAIGSNGPYRRLFESLDDAFCTFEMIYDAEGHPVDYRFLEVNDAFVAQTGLSREAVLGPSGRTIRELVPDHEQAWFDRYGEVAQTGMSIRIEDDAKGLGRRYEIHAFRMGGDGSREVGAIFKDVGKEELARQARAKAESRYQALFNSVDQGFCVVEMVYDAAGEPADYRFKEFNVAFEAQAGIPADKARAGLTIREIEPDIEASWIETYGRIARTGIPERFESGAAALDRFYEVYAFRMGGAGSREVGLIFKDIRERIAAERERERLLAELATAQGRLNAVLAAAEVGLWDYDPATGRIGGDANLGAMFGLDPETARHAPAETFIARIHPDDQASVAEAFGRAAEGTEYDIAFRTVVGNRVRHLLAQGFAERGATGRVVRMPGAVLDVTDVKTAQEAEQAATETFRTVFEQAPDDAILVMDRDRVLAAWNPAAERIMGWRAEEAIGQLADLIFTPEDRAQGAAIAETEEAARYGKATNERWHLKKDGTRFWGSGTMNALHDAAGNVTGFLKVFRDATARYEAERLVREMNQELEARVEERTRDLEREVEEAERFNYAISHDLRTPLRAIAMTSSVLLEEVGAGLDAEHQELLERQQAAAARMGKLIDGLLNLSRLARAPVTRQVVDMSEEARTVGQFEERCRVEVQPGMTAVGDPTLIHSLWQNLIGNACKFSPNGGTVRVGQEGEAFYVRDQGVGFDLRYAARIFQPFERLVGQDEFPGTGIGLANVERIVQRHGGRVWAESEPGKGSTFWFTLG